MSSKSQSLKCIVVQTLILKVTVDPNSIQWRRFKILKNLMQTIANCLDWVAEQAACWLSWPGLSGVPRVSEFIYGYHHTHIYSFTNLFSYYSTVILKFSLEVTIRTGGSEQDVHQKKIVRWRVTMFLEHYRPWMLGSEIANLHSGKTKRSTIIARECLQG